MEKIQQKKKTIALLVLMAMFLGMIGFPAVAEDTTAPDAVTVLTDRGELRIARGNVLTVNTWLSGTADLNLPVEVTGSFAEFIRINGQKITTASVYEIHYPDNGRQTTFSVALEGLPDGIKNNTKLGTITIGRTGDQKAQIAVYYSTLTTVDQIKTNTSEVRLTAGQKEYATVWLSPTPAITKEYNISVEGEYADYILTEGDPEGKLTFLPDGTLAKLSIWLDPAKTLPANLEDGYILGKVIIGGDNCQPAEIFVRYSRADRFLTEIVFLEKKLELEVGETYQLEPVMKPKSATNTNVAWTIEDEKLDDGNETVPSPGTIADVVDGLVTAKEPGTAVIKVEALKPDDVGATRASDTLKLTVYSAAGSDGYDVKVESAAAESIEGDDWKWNDATHALLYVTGRHHLKLTLVDKISGEVPTEPIQWQVNRRTVAHFLNGKGEEVSSKLVKQEAVDLYVETPGTVTIVAVGQSSGKRYSFTLESKVQYIDDIKLYYRDYYDNDPDSNILLAEGEELELAVDRKLQLTAERLPIDTSNTKVTWKSSNSRVAQVGRGDVLTAKSAGEAVITATVKRNPKPPTTVEPGETLLDPEVTASFKVKVVNGTDVSRITVTPCDEKGDPLDGAGAIITYIDDEVSNVHNSVENALTFSAGKTKYFLVHSEGATLTTSPKIKWQGTRTGYLTIKQSSLTRTDTLVSVKATNSPAKLKAYQIVRMVATNVGNFPVDNYPEIFFNIEPGAPDSMEITNASKLLEVGYTRELKISVKPKRTDESVTWAVNDTTIAEIGPDGVIKGLKPGTVTVTATSIKNPAISATAQITVGYKVSSAKLNATSIKLAKGETFQLLVSIKPYQAMENQISFVAAEDHIAYVNNEDGSPEKGLIKLYDTAQPGEKTKIYVYIGDPANPVKKLTCKVQVAADPVADPDSFEDMVADAKTTEFKMQPGDFKNLAYTVRGLTSAQKKRVRVEWEILNETSVDGVLGTEVLYLDPLGNVSVLTDPGANWAQVRAKFYYLKQDGTEVPLKTTNEENPDELIFTINIMPSLVLSVDGNEAKAKPDIILVDDFFTSAVLEARLTPPDGDANITWTPSKTFSRYLEMRPLIADGVENQNIQTVTLIGDRPTKTVTATLKLVYEQEGKKKSMLVKFKINPEV